MFHVHKRVELTYIIKWGVVLLPFRRAPPARHPSNENHSSSPCSSSFSSSGRPVCTSSSASGLSWCLVPGNLQAGAGHLGTEQDQWLTLNMQHTCTCTTLESQHTCTCTSTLTTFLILYAYTESLSAQRKLPHCRHSPGIGGAPGGPGGGGGAPGMPGGGGGGGGPPPGPGGGGGGGGTFPGGGGGGAAPPAGAVGLLIS